MGAARYIVAKKAQKCLYSDKADNFLVYDLKEKDRLYALGYSVLSGGGPLHTVDCCDVIHMAALNIERWNKLDNKQGHSLIKCNVDIIRFALAYREDEFYLDADCQFKECFPLMSI